MCMVVGVCGVFLHGILHVCTNVSPGYCVGTYVCTCTYVCLGIWVTVAG